jgi:redox-sensitive bicupin YhaK (pirin superfamily)
MAAGRGVIHSEMPIMEEGDLHGFQIWINQPARDKMKPAQYVDFQPETITEHSDEQLGLIRVLAGTINANEMQLKGPLNTTGVELSVSDWRAEIDQQVSVSVPEQFNMMILNYQGKVQVGDYTLNQGELAMLSKGERVDLKALEQSGVLIFAGEPIDEPVVHYGPFVMNTMDEINQTIQDYNSGVFETY